MRGHLATILAPTFAASPDSSSLKSLQAALTTNTLPRATYVVPERVEPPVAPPRLRLAARPPTKKLTKVDIFITILLSLVFIAHVKAVQLYLCNCFISQGYYYEEPVQEPEVTHEAAVPEIESEDVSESEVVVDEFLSSDDDDRSYYQQLRSYLQRHQPNSAVLASLPQAESARQPHSDALSSPSVSTYTISSAPDLSVGSSSPALSRSSIPTLVKQEHCKSLDQETLASGFESELTAALPSSPGYSASVPVTCMRARVGRCNLLWFDSMTLSPPPLSAFSIFSDRDVTGNRSSSASIADCSDDDD